MTTPKKSTKKSAVEDTFSEDESLSTMSNPSAKISDPFEDDDDFDLPLDDLDGLENFDTDDEDDY
ncbi:MAG: hypothetical protein JWQ28_2940 [Pedobacter sp.]|jgi:hypothetical protein|nr:hypothetical protein [Pedobacter sp.]